MALINGGTDIILVARRPSLDELMAASKAEEVLDVVPIALDAFVFLANSANPMASLSSEQIRAIYSGQVTDWAQVGGAPGPIRAFQRDRNSGSQELMEEMVMKGAAMVEAPDMLLETMSGPINAIGTEIWGIGYSVYYYATVMLPDPKVKLLAINGVTPSADTIRDGSYPLTTEVYAVILRESPWAPHIGGGRQGRPDRTSARILRDWLLTPAGQEVVVESGYVPLLVVNPSGQAASRLFVADQLRTPQAS
jgi:phosphate transport system substrate-binding protein